MLISNCNASPGQGEIAVDILLFNELFDGFDVRYLEFG